ncbi:glutamate--tRNA ligase [Candidatus Kaiserbacteria bacterium]|nr:glutamate--tRNA ligase [Candidatus Kaiserbacteria bacterium]
MSVITRFAPSPTGLLHGGNYRTAVFAYLFARQQKGHFILRIEDTDKARSKPEYEANILESLQWLGIDWDSFARQSDRLAQHQAAVKRLIDSDHAYLSHETSAEGKESDLIRFRNPGGVITFDDLVRGPINTDVTDLGDFIIARNIDEPLFHLAVVVDDGEMSVTHIVRGDDHIANTPRQILIQRALGFTEPRYAHLPIVLGPDRAKLSKRRGAKALTEYRDAGYLPESMLNFLALIGWNPGTEQEIFSKDQLVEAFNFSGIQHHGAIFNEEKLRWFNREYLLRMTTDDFSTYTMPVLKEALTERLPALAFSHAETSMKEGAAAGGITDMDATIAQKLLPVIRERISTSNDLRTMVGEGELDYYFKKPILDVTKIPFKGGSPTDTVKHLQHVKETFVKSSQDQFKDPENIKSLIWDYATEIGRGAVLWPLRFALTGAERSPDPFTVISIIGLTETLARIKVAHNLLEASGLST